MIRELSEAEKGAVDRAKQWRIGTPCIDLVGCAARLIEEMIG